MIAFVCIFTPSPDSLPLCHDRETEGKSPSLPLCLPPTLPPSEVRVRIERVRKGFLSYPYALPLIPYPFGVILASLSEGEGYG